MSGRFSIEPSALVTRFWKAAAGLKNMCANLDQNTVPNSTVAAAMNRTKKKIAPNTDQSSANVVFRVVLAEAGSHVAVDCVQTLRHGAGTVYVSFLSDDDLLVLTPVARFESSAGTAEAGTRDQDVDVVFYDRFVGH